MPLFIKGFKERFVGGYLNFFPCLGFRNPAEAFFIVPILMPSLSIDDYLQRV